MVRGSFHQRVVDQLCGTGLEHWSHELPTVEAGMFFHSDGGEMQACLEIKKFTSFDPESLGLVGFFRHL